MLKFVIIAVVTTLCLSDSQDLGENDYIACDDCQVPDGEFPEEGKMVCFKVKRGFKSTTVSVYRCRDVYVECDPFDFFCVLGTKKECGWEKVNIPVPQCELERKTDYRSIDQIRVGELDVMYHIHSPRYYTDSDYPNNTYCVWNVANSGLVSYHIMNQQLQEPVTLDCDGPGCDCPDGVKITMGNNKLKLCGSTMLLITYLLSSNGLHVKFCSDNKHTAKGIFIRAYKFSKYGIMQKRKAIQPTEGSGNDTVEVDEATCQYDYMMRASQPDVPCPDNLTILTLLEHHNHFMSVPSQNDEMCSELSYPTEMNTAMPQMNKIEMCAVEYLYRTRDCKFAREVVKSTNKELRSVAHAVIKNDFPKTPKWMHITPCSQRDIDDDF